MSAILNSVRYLVFGDILKPNSIRYSYSFCKIYSSHSAQNLNVPNLYVTRTKRPAKLYWDQNGNIYKTENHQNLNVTKRINHLN